jgi:hypothetical protein
MIGRRGAARLDADDAAFRLDLLDELGEVDADNGWQMNTDTMGVYYGFHIHLMCLPCA